METVKAIVGELSFEVAETEEGLVLPVRVVDSQRGCGFDTEAKPEELKQLAHYLESAGGK